MYVPVHQVWSYVVAKPKSENSLIMNSNSNTQPVDKTRHIVQLTRIKKKLDIITLSKQIGTTPRALSSYEKGDDILPKEVLENLLNLLEIQFKKTG
jgi:ribosome-binding protein aMBF1 (putative translation factor)